MLPFPLINQKTRPVALAVLALALAAAALVYLPGLSGPYLYDDHTNILRNSYLRLDSLEPLALWHASLSVDSGPLMRPLSMLSFALNHYFAGGFDDTTPLKLTNLGIHVVNGLLIFWLMRLIFARLSQIGGVNSPNTNRIAGINKIDLLAGAVALLWIVHPINLTSVLYVVQRMTLLAAFFTLLGLICYLKGRNHTGDPRGAWLIAFGVFVCGGLGVLSKENAALLLAFMLAVDLILFADEPPWRFWPQLSARKKGLIVATILAIATAILIWVLDFALPLYGGREFSVLERLLTESRVLFFYLSLIVLPRINQFGLHHDDIVISGSLFSPWTTFSSLVGILGLLVAAVLVRRKLPLLSLGILWFFAGHLMESTIIPLEIAHEHRNYLACLGILFAIVHLLHQCSARLGHSKLLLLYPVLALSFGGVTLLRTVQWSDSNSLARYEAAHHPDSARTQLVLSSLLHAQGDLRGALEAVRRAAALAPQEAAYKINLQLLAVRLGISLEPALQAETLDLLATKPVSPSTALALESVVDCVDKDCRQLQGPLKAWLVTLIDNLPASADRSYLYYLLGHALLAQGEILDGINTLERAYRADPSYLHPLFKLADVFLQLGQTENVELVLNRIREANKNNLHPRDKEIGELAAALEALKSETQEMSQSEF